mmetsp:Transcript_27544/g.81028  ORF Transcript_27544/g.81028 Transcript_27544/m.81028 type:complete len:1376 (-) Transcript_27544:76-4203(-)
MVFEKTLTDVVKGIRASKRDTALYISSCIADIKNEINSTDIHVKANALQKLTFLQMLGYNMSWASFASIEVMSSPRFAHKRVGYLAASQGFTQDTEVILLTTNLFKKELRGVAGGGTAGSYEAGLAINCLSNIVTDDLARELLPELTNLTTHPQPYLRKKAVLCLFKVFVKYPQGLRLTFARVQQCLNDTNPSVVSCAVNVVTELSDKNPKNYLPLAPAFFGLLTGSSNNWMLIKVIKLLGSLVPEEPRLARKLLDPLANIVKGTQAKSLLYEAVYTITLCLPYCRKSDGSLPPSAPQIVTLCAEVLRGFVEDNDQNLKYLGLVGFGSLMSSHPRVLSAPDYRPLILACLSDEDVTIRTRALGLLTGMATRKNLMELVTQLLRHVDLAAGKYKCDLIEKIVETCSADRYALLQDFGWYVDVLVQFGRMRGIERHGSLVAGQLVDVALRVLPVRSYAVRRMATLLMAAGGSGSKSSNSGHVLPEILPAAAWIVGEYSCLIGEAVAMESGDIEDDGGDWKYDAASKGQYHSLVQALSAPSFVGVMDIRAQATFIQASVKVLAAASAASRKRCSDTELGACLQTLSGHLPVFMESTDCEVRERACTSYQLLDSMELFPMSSSVSAGVPGLVPVQKSSDDSDSESSSDEETPEHSDLLGLDPAAPATSSKAGRRAIQSAGTLDSLGLDGIGSSSISSGVAPRCRSASPLLIFLLTPEPMKPVSAKAQRKIQRAPPAGLRVDLDAPPDLSAFGSLIDRECAQRPARALVESVSFTDQRVPASSAGRDSIGVTNIEKGVADLATLDRGSFQHTGGAPLLSGTSGQQQQQDRKSGDPFYLNSGPGETDIFGSGAEPSAADQASSLTAQQSKFGTIQLLDSENDDSDTSGKKKKHKRKDKKKKKKKAGDSLGVADLAVLAGPSAARSSSSSKIIIGSDEEDDDEDNVPIAAMISQKTKQTRKDSVQAKEFAGLAKVDLTAPLRDDEVMPKNEHYVVPEKRQQHDTAQEGGGKRKKKKKKEKRQKKEKKKEKRSDGGTSLQAGDATGDLLGFGGMFADSGTAVDNATVQVGGDIKAAPVVGSSAAISSAFDDLLDLQPVPAPSLSSSGMLPSGPTLADASMAVGNIEQGAKTKKKKSRKKGSGSRKKPWQRAAVKVSQGTGGGWDGTTLYYRTSPRVRGDGPPTATIVFKVVSDQGIFQGLQASFDGGVAASVTIGDISPGSPAESSAKAGPFNYSSDAGSAPEIRGRLHASDGSSVPFKLTLPLVAFLEPVEGVTHDGMMEELSSGRQWASHSAKVEISSIGIDATAVKMAVQTFLRAGLVQGQGDEKSSAVAASCPTMGAQIRALIKVKTAADGTGVAKVDIKTTHDNLGKSLASDLKKVVI